MKRFQIFVFAILTAVGLTYCGGRSGKGTTGESPEFSATKERQIRSYNLKVQEKEKKHRTPCDAIALKKYILDNYNEGTYLVEFDKTFTYSLPKPAMLDYRYKGNHYVFAVIAKSKPGERFIETKNIVGYESSFINLDSTKLGTAFFYLTLFKCVKDSSFQKLWEAEVPIHGGFNSMTIKRWKKENIRYIDLNYEDGIISGHRDFNFFFINGIEKKPHLMETYEGIAYKRTLADVNEDKYPDYYEYRFVDSTNFVRLIDSIPFYWDTTKHLYVTKVNRRWWRKY